MFIVVYITCSDKEEAEKIADLLIRKKLVACVNYFPINSIYEWRGRVERDGEYALICKTIRENFEKIEVEVKRVHSYENPAIISIPIIDGSGEFLDWISSITKHPTI